MDDQAIDQVVEEIKPLLVGRVPGKLFQLEPWSLAIDFRLRDHRYLFISVDPALPRIHLIKRRARDLEKLSIGLSPFALTLGKNLSRTTLSSVEKDPGDRIVRFRFTGKDELGRARECVLIAQLTGRAANLFLLDRDGLITHQARVARGVGQQVKERYRQPDTSARRVATSESELLKEIRSGRFTSISEAADAHYSSLIHQQVFNAKASAARADLRRKISRHEKLLKQLQNDLASHAEMEQHKRIGELLLANLNTAKRNRKRVKLVDYFAPDAPLIEISIDEKLTLQQEASRRFALYSRSKRALQQINARVSVVLAELDDLHSQGRRFEKIIADRNAAALEELTGLLSVPPALAGGLKRKPEKRIPGTRRYLSSDGFEILVGRAARDNDTLTFKIARPNDLWLHAADYPGSHVVVRNPSRRDVPHRTIIEAAQLAAHFSQARKDPKVDVHYTQRKFLSKPKGVAPGLVRMSQFRNITVAPGENLKRS